MLQNWNTNEAVTCEWQGHRCPDVTCWDWDPQANHGNFKFGGTDIIKIWFKKVLSFIIVAPICPTLIWDHALEFYFCNSDDIRHKLIQIRNWLLKYRK